MPGPFLYFLGASASNDFILQKQKQQEKTLKARIRNSSLSILIFNCNDKTTYHKASVGRHAVGDSLHATVRQQHAVLSRYLRHTERVFLNI
jgi:hypothetical protein